ncbi:MAG: hypothetical protein ABR583_14325 [Gaiellaceae bacterium]
MRRLLALTVLVAATIAAGVAMGGGKPPPDPSAKLERQVARLQAEVQRLRADRAKLRDQKAALASRLTSRERDRETLRRALAAETSCPITVPNGRSPTGEPAGVWHGNGALAVGLWPRGVLAPGDGQRDADGSLAAKFGWWRSADVVITIEGRSLDGVGPLLRGSAGDVLGTSGLVPSLIDFPSPGCWEVTGHAGATSLTFVVLVVGY